MRCRHWALESAIVLGRDLQLIVLRRLLPLVIVLAGCGTVTPAERLEQTLSITASGVVAADDGLYTYAKVRADEIARTAPSVAVGEIQLAALEKDVLAARAALVAVKALLVVGLTIARAVKAGAAVTLISTWLPTLTTAISEANKMIAAIGAVTPLPSIAPVLP